MHKGKRILTLLSLLVIASMLIAALAAPPSAPAAPAEAPAEAALRKLPRRSGPGRKTTEEVRPDRSTCRRGRPAEGSDRSKTLIMDIDGGRMLDEMWNPIRPATAAIRASTRSVWSRCSSSTTRPANLCHGWVRASPNETNDVWTLKLRDGVTWQMARLSMLTTWSSQSTP